MTAEKLSLTTDRQPDVVEIDGKPYELLAYEEMSMLQTTKLRRLTLRHTELARLNEHTDAQAAEMDSIVEEMARLMLPDAPPEVLSRLSRKSKAQLASFFFQRIATAAGIKTQESSSSSPISTEAAPGNG